MQPYNCSICLENLGSSPLGDKDKVIIKDKNISALPCGHVFHNYCIQKWIKKGISAVTGKFSCPYCKRGCFHKELIFLLFLTQSNEEDNARPVGENDILRDRDNLQKMVLQLSLRLKIAENTLKDDLNTIRKLEHYNNYMKLMTQTMETELRLANQTKVQMEKEIEELKRKNSVLVMERTSKIKTNLETPGKTRKKIKLENLHSNENQTHCSSVSKILTSMPRHMHPKSRIYTAWTGGFVNGKAIVRNHDDLTTAAPIPVYDCF